MPVCEASKTSFSISTQDQQYYESLGIPAPRLSPIERMRRRLTFRHGGSLHHNSCALTGKKIISMYAPSAKLVVYEQNAWWSDEWSGISFARDFDFARPFFPQFEALYYDVPHISLLSTNSDNSYYTNHGLNLKNCYLLFGATNDEDCLYGYFILSCKDVLDSTSLVSCELCFDGVASFDCYNCISLTNSKNCTDCVLIEDCHSCEQCLACVGLHGKKYHVLNEPVGKEEFQRIQQDLQKNKYSALESWQGRFESLKRSSPRRYAHLYNCEDCTGDMLFNCKDCLDTFDSRNSEKCQYLAFSPNSLHSRDCNFTAPDGVQFCHDCVSTLAKDSKFNAIVWRCSEVDYSMECHNSHNLFGCVGLKNSSYCIFNKQYSSTDYFAVRAKIIERMRKSGEWGEFFPVSMSPYPYNDSMAQHYFPLNAREALDRGYSWRNDEAATSSLPATTPDPTPAIDDSDETILSSTLICSNTAKRFKVTASELSFYRKMGLPLPSLAPDERNRLRFKRRTPYQLFPRQCAHCSTALSSVYSETAAAVVLCEKDYLAQVS